MNPEPKISDSYYLNLHSDEIQRIKPPAPLPEPPSPPPKPARDWAAADLPRLSLRDLESLFADAQRGDQVATAAFNLFLDNDGNAAWREAGDMANAAGKALANKLFAKQKSIALSSRRRFQELRMQLSEDHATPVEKLAIDRVILASMFACALDCLVAAEGADGLTAETRLKAQALAEKRVQVAFKTLQTAREISRAAVAGPLRLFGSQARSQTSAPAAATV